MCHSIRWLKLEGFNTKCSDIWKQKSYYQIPCYFQYKEANFKFLEREMILIIDRSELTKMWIIYSDTHIDLKITKLLSGTAHSFLSQPRSAFASSVWLALPVMFPPSPTPTSSLLAGPGLNLGCSDFSFSSDKLSSLCVCVCRTEWRPQGAVETLTTHFIPMVPHTTGAAVLWSGQAGGPTREQGNSCS